MQLNLSRFDSPAAKEADRIKRIKEVAGEKILEILPEWKQRNLLARGNELTEIVASGGTLTAEEQAEVAALKASWAQIKDIRAKSDAAELSGVQPSEIVW